MLYDTMEHDFGVVPFRVRPTTQNLEDQFGPESL